MYHFSFQGLSQDFSDKKSQMVFSVRSGNLFLIIFKTEKKDKIRVSVTCLGDKQF